MESRYYPGVEADVIKLMTELRDVFDEDFEVQTMQVSSTAVLQARKSSTLRDLTGLSAALTIKVTPETGGTRVEMGLQKWFDKALPGLPGLTGAPGHRRLLAIQTYRRCMEDYRSTHRGQSRRLCSAAARAMRNLRRGCQCRFNFLFRMRR